MAEPTVARLLKNVLHERRWTIDQLWRFARDAGVEVPRSTLGDWMAGTSVPRDRDLADSLLRCLGFNDQDIVNALAGSFRRVVVLASLPWKERRTEYAPQVIDLTRHLADRLRSIPRGPHALLAAIRAIRAAFIEWPLLRAALEGSWPMATEEQTKALDALIEACGTIITQMIHRSLHPRVAELLTGDDFAALSRTIVRSEFGSVNEAYRGAPHAPQLRALERRRMTQSDAEADMREICDSVVGHAYLLAARRGAASRKHRGLFGLLVEQE